MRKLYFAINSFLVALQIMAVLCALAQPAYAYVDPGSGLLAFQMISTTFAGLVFMARNRIRKFFRIRLSKSEIENSGQE